MAISKLLRTYFAPIQPTVGLEECSVLYKESLPAIPLQNLIYCYWQLKSNTILTTPFTYKVIADGCIDVFFNLANPTESFVMGFCKEYTAFSLNCHFNYIGIRFFPSVFPRLFPIKAKDLSNACYPLKWVLPDFAALIEKNWKPEAALSEVRLQLDAYLGACLEQRTLEVDPRFYEALICILNKKGVIKTEKELKTGLSSRQLRRVFDTYIGTTPKTFSKVVQFQSILNAQSLGELPHTNKLYYDAGFFDQAHFIRDFKKFYGQTPAKVLK